MNILWSPLALDRMEEIAAYIAEDNPEVAERWIENVFARVKTLSRFPESGREVPEIRRREIRELVLGNYRVIYRIRDEEFAILTIRHVKQILPVEEVNESGIELWR
jgi:toxin ParE1/3/4